MIPALTDRRLQRRDFLKSAAATAAVPLMAASRPAQPAAAAAPIGKHIVLFMTDQQRAIQHFPRGWEQKNLPGMTRLKRNGISFERAFASACMCSPSRACMLSGYFSAQNGVTQTFLTPDPNLYPHQLPTSLPNWATVMKAAGYETVYKGKWHASIASTTQDLEAYGFDGWDPPDGGGDTEPDDFGGGNADYDGRYMQDALEYLDTKDQNSDPFFLVVSLINPHDVLGYPDPDKWQAGGYSAADGWFNGRIPMPPTMNEKLRRTKPAVQSEALALLAASLSPIPQLAKRQNYLNFYANLMKKSDSYLVQILEKLDEKGLTNDTLVIQTSDHGEMGLAHGGLRQKIYNFYEETIRVPLIYSNPQMFPKPKKSMALVSHVDLLPTLAGLVNAPQSARAKWQGRDYSGLIRGTRKKGVQDYVVFTFQEKLSQYIKGPRYITAIRENRYKLAKYYNPDRPKQVTFEMYDLKKDPLERRNLASPKVKTTKRQKQQLKRLKRKLRNVQKARLQPLAA